MRKKIQKMLKSRKNLAKILIGTAKVQKSRFGGKNKIAKTKEMSQSF
jgi:hypothetical protein